MAENNQYQPGTEDLKLAQTLNKISQTGDIPGDAGDEMFGLLMAYKDQVYLKESDSAGDETWQQIENGIRIQKKIDGSNDSARIFSLSNPYLKAAAVLLAFIMLSLLYLTLHDRQTKFIAVTDSEKTEVFLDDGSVVTLRPNSSLELIEESTSEIIYRLTGEGYFDINRNESRTFSVIADNGRIDVLGTRFTLSTWSNRVRVFLEEGRVRFSEIESGDSIELLPGEFSNLTTEGVSQPVSANPIIYTAWLNDEIYLEQRSLDEIAAELSHHYAIDIVIPEELKDESLSGTIVLDELSEVLEVLALSLNGEFVRTGGNSYRFIENP